MTDDAATVLERLVSVCRCGQTLVLLFDYDGTLVPIARVAEQLRPVLADFAGAWIESKAAGLTVHDRNVRADRLNEVLNSIRLCLAPWTAQLTIVGGPKAIEVTPQDGWNKGTAVQMILDCVGRDTAFPLFIGDEANDADAFAVVSALGGASISVGPQAPSTASYRLRDPNAVTEFLAAVLESLDEVRPKP